MGTPPPAARLNTRLLGVGAGHTEPLKELQGDFITPTHTVPSTEMVYFYVAPSLRPQVFRAISQSIWRWKPQEWLPFDLCSGLPKLV